MRHLLIPLAALCLAAPALAQGKPPLGDAARAMLGPWEFSNAGREKVCTATFKNDATAVGYKVEFDPHCATLYPLVARVAGWKYPDNDFLFLLDAEGNALVEFSEVEDGIFEAPTAGVGVLFLQNPAAAGAPAKPASAIAGDWTLRRGSAVLCAFALSAAPSSDALALTVKPGCAVSIAQLGFSQWRLERGELVLVPARGTPWRFEENDDNGWNRVPEGAEPVTLARP